MAANNTAASVAQNTSDKNYIRPDLVLIARELHLHRSVGVYLGCG